MFKTLEVSVRTCVHYDDFLKVLGAPSETISQKVYKTSAE